MTAKETLKKDDSGGLAENVSGKFGCQDMLLHLLKISESERAWNGGWRRGACPEGGSGRTSSHLTSKRKCGTETESCRTQIASQTFPSITGAFFHPFSGASIGTSKSNLMLQLSDTFTEESQYTKYTKHAKSQRYREKLQHLTGILQFAFLSLYWDLLLSAGLRACPSEDQEASVLVVSVEALQPGLFSCDR